jgi:hypothetical protein
MSRARMLHWRWTRAAPRHRPRPRPAPRALSSGPVARVNSARSSLKSTVYSSGSRRSAESPPTRLRRCVCRAEDVGAAIVARRVLAPPRDRHVAPAAVAGAGGRSASRRSGRWKAASRRRRLMRKRSCARRTIHVARARCRLDLRRPGRVEATSRGTRSCNSNSVAWMIGSAWNRSRIAPSNRPRWRSRRSSCPDDAP